MRPLHQAKTGSWVYVSRTQATEEGEEDERLKGIRRKPRKRKSRHKLQSKSTGPYEVLDHDDHTVTIEYPDRLVENISRDRAVKAQNRWKKENRNAGI